MKTSEILQRQIQDIDADYEEMEGPIDPEEKRIHQLLQQLTIDAVESSLPAQLAYALAGSLKTVLLDEWHLDDIYSRVLVREMPKVVERARKLAPVWIMRAPSKPADVYLREATRAFLFGLLQATVALCRSALEQSLKDRLRSQLSVLAEADELFVLLRIAEKLRPRILEPSLIQLGHDIRNTGNSVLHGTPCTEQGAFDSLIKTRKILSALHE